MKRLAFLLLALSAGCATPPPQPAVVAWTGMVRWIETETPSADCDRLLGRRGMRFGTPSAGCYTLQRDGTCLVITERIRREQDLGTIGHEVKHCRDGDFHDDEGRWR